jgi:hypothetical protein
MLRQVKVELSVATAGDETFDRQERGGPLIDCHTSRHSRSLVAVAGVRFGAGQRGSERALFCLKLVNSERSRTRDIECLSDRV